jgi:hypothetical protein
MHDRVEPGEGSVACVSVGDVEGVDAVDGPQVGGPQAPAVAQPRVTADPIAPAAPVTSTRGLSVTPGIPAFI